MPLRLLIDCDPGIDDALALTYAFAHPEVSVEGIVATGGNVSTEQVGRNIRGLLHLLGAPHIPWELGAINPLAQALITTEETHGPLGTGYALLPGQQEPTEKEHGRGAELWVETAARYPGELHGIVLGPSTNLALALELDPTLPSKLGSLHIMGGALNHRGNTMPTTEWNVHSDPEALASVLTAFDGPGATCSPVLCPLDHTENSLITPERRAALTAGGGALLEALDLALQFYMEFHESDGLGFIAHVHDPFVTALAVNTALDNGLVLALSLPVALDVELTGTLTRGQTVADWLGRWGREPNAKALVAADAETFFEHFIETVRARYAVAS